MMAALFLLVLNSCEKPAPTADFTYSVEGLTVTFTSVVTDTESYLWEFGDGETSTEANPVHVYTGGGDFEVTLTATGEGGTDSKKETITVTPNLDDVKRWLTGGEGDNDGKTWVMSAGYTEGVDGGSGVEPNMMILFGSMPNFLTAIGFPDEYEDEFTFFHDGSYVVDNKNGKSVANLMAALFAGLGGEVIQTEQGNEVGLCTKAYTAPESSTWTLHEDDLVIQAAPYGGTDVPAATYPVTFSGKKWIEVTDGAYFGILDYPNTRKFIVKSISPESMSVAIFISAYWSDPAGSGGYPTLMYHMTFVPKQ